MSNLLNRFGDYLLEKALAAEYKRAGLVSASAKLPFGDIEYLCSQNRSGQPAEAIVMLHGATADKTVWTRLAGHLNSPLLLIIPDLPGHGKSSADITQDYSIQAQALRLEALLAHLGIQRVHLIGNSMGGAIALHLAAHAPERVASLVLINTAGVEITPSWLRQQVTRTGINPLIEVRNTADYRAMIRIGMEAPPYMPGMIVSALARAFIRRTAINQKILADIGRDLDQTDSLARIAAPSLIIWGAADKVLHVDNADFLQQRLPGSRKLIMDGVGHAPMLEAPTQVAMACKAFLAEVTQAVCA